MKMKLGLMVLGLLAFFGPPTLAQDTPQAFTITAEAVPLNKDELGQSVIGKLKYLKGWSLKGDHHQFGGLSALRMLPKEDGTYDLLSISDNGLWLRAEFDPEGAEPFKGATLTWQRPLPEYSSEKQDSESIVVLEDGYLIGVEQLHRIMKVSEPGKPAVRSPLTDHIDFREAGSNGGLEAMTMLQDGRVLAFLENGRTREGYYKSYLLSEDKGELLYLKSPDDFRPTDATTLPNGDVIVITRYYSFLHGVAVRLYRVSSQDIRAGNLMEGELLAEMRRPITVDNMEGVDAVTTPDGRTLVFMLSDDNQSSRQRTLLMMFELQD